MKKFLLFSLFLCVALTFAQNTAKPKWGKISKSEIEYQKVPFETDAFAVVLYAEGKTDIETQFTTKVYKRIKILDERGVEAANRELVYYKHNGRERISKLKAQTINIENGKEVVNQVEKGAIFGVDLNDYYSAVKFTFPNVKVGSVLEFEYELFSDWIGYIEAWTFQDDYPTLYSSYQLNNRSSFDYTILLMGARVRNMKSATQWSLSNLNSFGYTDFVYNPKNSSEKVALQLKGLMTMQKNYGGTSEYKSFMGNWRDLNKELEELHNQKKNQSIAREIADLIPNGANELETLQNVHDYFNQHFKWNNYYSIVGTQNFRETHKNRNGSSADLNLLLNSVLKAKNLQTDLLVFSTRRNGKIIISYPYLGQFNQVCNMVTLGNGEYYLLDASDLSNGLGYMNLNNYNLVAMVLNSKKEEFIQMNQRVSTYQSTQIYGFKDGQFLLTRTDKKKGYLAEDEVMNQKGRVKLLPVGNSLDLMTQENSVDQREENGFKLERIKSETVGIGEAGFIGLENPLKQLLNRFRIKESNRELPLEFDFPFHYVVDVVVDIPDGYTAEIPAQFQAQHKVGKDEMLYYQKAEIDNSKLKLHYEFFLSRGFYEKQLPQIKSFFEQMNLEANKVVLLKKK